MFQYGDLLLNKFPEYFDILICVSLLFIGLLPPQISRATFGFQRLDSKWVTKDRKVLAVIQKNAR